MVKGNRISLEHYYSSCCPDEVFRQIYQGYRKECTARRKLDFDDMLLYCYELFQQRQDILQAWQNKFRYILVDEFQDTSVLQWRILRAIVEGSKNAVIVGDAKQSIYGWRDGEKKLFENLENILDGEVNVNSLAKTYRTKEKVMIFLNKFFFCVHTFYLFKKPKNMRSFPVKYRWVICE